MIVVVYRYCWLRSRTVVIIKSEVDCFLAESKMSSTVAAPIIPESLPIAEAMTVYLHKESGCYFPTFVSPEDISNIKSVEVKPDDVILATYPKCGTTWTMEILSLIINQGVQHSSVERAAAASATGTLELPTARSNRYLGYNKLGSIPPPRVYCTHLGLKFLPLQVWEKKPRILYVSRNPKDCIASLYHFAGVAEVPGMRTWDEFFDSFITGKVYWGSFYDHVLQYWNHRQDENILFIKYEDLKKDPATWISKIADHIHHPISPEIVERVVKYSSITEMKKAFDKVEAELENGADYTRALGKMPFVRKGKVGGWKTHFTVAQNELFDKMHEEKLTGTGLEFNFI